MIGFLLLISLGLACLPVGVTFLWSGLRDGKDVSGWISVGLGLALSGFGAGLILYAFDLIFSFPAVL